MLQPQSEILKRAAKRARVGGVGAVGDTDVDVYQAKTE